MADKEPTSCAAATTVVCVSQCVTVDKLRCDKEYEVVMEDLKQLGEMFAGTLTNVVIPRPNPSGEPVAGLGKVFFKYTDTVGSLAARAGLNGKKFGGNDEVVAVFYPEDKFDEGDFGA